MASLSFTPMPDIPQTRRSLLIELGRRSDDAWTEFLAAYEQAIYRLCRSRGLQDADARDVTQEVLAAVHDRVPTWDHDAGTSFRGWVLRVARNVCVDVIRDRAQRGASGDTIAESLLLELPDSREADQTAFDLNYRRSVFEVAARKVRGEVRDVTWRAFQLTAIEGRSAAEAARELDVPVGSVYTAKCRVVARIRERVEALGAELEEGA